MNQWMQVAYDEAIKGMLANAGGPFGAVIIKDNKVIASAHNQVLFTNDPTAHAEINVIRQASQKLQKFDLSDCTLYTTCQPCPMCLGAIFWARIPNVYYGATKDDAKKGGFDDALFYDLIQSKNTFLQQIDHQKNAQLFDIWLKKKDIQIY
jgi:guanine deaminase